MTWKSTISENYQSLKPRLQSACSLAKRSIDEVKLIWVSKTNPIEAVEAATEVGLLDGLPFVDFGENKVQECVEKFHTPHPNRKLHLIGPLQSNKLRKAVQLCDVIHTVSSNKHLKAIERIAQEEDRKISILFQVNTSGEDSKSGLQLNEAADFLKALPPSANLTYAGLMTIGVNSGEPEDSRAGFSQLRTLRDQFLGLDERFSNFKELSMGMTSDLEVALQEGATMIRIGTALFGERDYSQTSAQTIQKFQNQSNPFDAETKLSDGDSQ